MPTATEKREFKRFTLVGFAATVIDYGVLNGLTYMFGIPIVAANIVSASSSSLFSYILNRKIVFKNIAHGERKSLVLYTVSVLVSIFVIQTIVVALLGRGVLQGFYETFGVSGTGNELLAVNTAKFIAGVLSMVWNFYTQRRWVFVSNSERHN